MFDLINKSPSELKELESTMSGLSSILLIIAIIGAFLLILAFVRRKQKQATINRGPMISRTSFASDCFGMVYDNQDTSEPYLHYALIFDTQGKELCRYEEAEGQTIHGFTTDNGILYMHTTETYEDGTQSPVRWMYMPAQNELVECD